MVRSDGQYILVHDAHGFVAMYLSTPLTKSSIDAK
jgi:hypothetical protein